MADINYLAIQKAELERIIEGHNTHHPSSNACYICYLIRERNSMLSDKDIEMISEAAKKYLDGDSPTFKFISKQQEDFFKRRSGEMADTEDLKSSALKEHEGSSPSSGKLLWCNAHQRRAERCKTEGGILLPCEIVDLTGMVIIDESIDGALKDLMRAHECLLNTLAPSKSNWIKDVHHNAKAYYQTWLKKYIMR